MQRRLIKAACAALSLAFGPWAPLRADEADDQYSIAAAHYQNHRWNLAAAEFRAFLADHSADDRANRARFYLAESLVQLGDLPAAAELFARLRDSTDAELARKALFRTGEAEYLSGRIDEAEQDLRLFCERYREDKQNGYALSYRGEIALARNRAGEASRLFKTALDRFPDGPLVEDCRFGIARACLKQDQTDEARRRLAELAAARGSRAADAHYLLATIDYADRDYQAAARSFAAATELAGNGPLAEKSRLGRGRALYHLQDYDEAAASLEGLASSPSLGAEARYWLGLVRKAQSNWDAAAQLLLEAANTAETPQHQARTLAELATCYTSAKEFDKARQAYARLSKLRPKSELLRPTCEFLAAGALAGGDFVWAEELFSTLANDTNPPDTIARALLGLGRAQLMAGKPAEAERTLARLIDSSLDEPCIEASLLRGHALEKLDRLGAALAMYERVIKLAPPDSADADRGLERCASIYDRFERWSDAAKCYEQLAVRPGQQPDSDAILYRWAWAVYKLGERDKAFELFESLRREYATSPLCADATCRLAEEAIRVRQFDRAEELLGSLDDEHLADDVSARALYLRGQSAIGQEKWSDVSRPLVRLLDRYPKSPLARTAEYWLAEAAYRQADYDQAAKRFDALAALTRGDADGVPAWHAMIPLRTAQILAQQGKFSEAADLAATIPAKYPNFDQQFEADYVIGRAAAARADFETARENYCKVLRSPAGCKTETAAMAQWMIGETYMHQRDYRRALAAYLKVDILYAYPRWQAAALLQAGKCHEFLGEPAEAAKVYDRLLSVYPDTTYHDEAARRLELLRR
jgi:TolA-binding protein